MCLPALGLRGAESNPVDLYFLQHTTSTTTMQRMMKPADPMIMYFIYDIVEVTDPVGASVVLVVGDAVECFVGLSSG